MPARLIKQIIYGGFYLFFLALVVVGGYFLIRPAPSCFDNRQNQGETDVDCGGSCIECALKNVESITLFGDPQFAALDSQTISLFFQLKNPNPTYGAENFSYHINIYDAVGRQIYSVSKESFIYAGQIKTVAEPVIKINPRAVSRIEVSATNPLWQSSQNWTRPSLQSRAIKTEVIKNQGKITGLVLNNSSILLENVEIAAILYDLAGKLVAVSKTILKDLQSFEERAFTVFVPLEGKMINPNATQIFLDAKR